MTVLSANGWHPTLKMQFSELLKHLDLVLHYDWDTWIFDEGDDWIIEHYHHGEWCWGKAPYGGSR